MQACGQSRAVPRTRLAMHIATFGSLTCGDKSLADCAANTLLTGACTFMAAGGGFAKPANFPHIPQRLAPCASSRTYARTTTSDLLKLLFVLTSFVRFGRFHPPAVAVGVGDGRPRKLEGLPAAGRLYPH